MKSFFGIILFLMAFITVSQTTINGTIIDENGLPIPGANIYIEGSYDGGTSNNEGMFSFKSEEKGVQTLIVSFLAFETYKNKIDVVKMNDLKIILREDVNALDAVVLSAGSFSAGDTSKISVLKALDVVTTASAIGDVVGAIQTLPGTSTVAEDGRLFVRGGDANETQIFIDGIRVFTPYSPTANNVPTRGRYSPFLFDGITFSTGGYSAEFGQALSSVLLLNTIDEPDQNKTEIGIMTVGGTLGNTRKWQRSSLSVNASYISLAPYTALFPGRNDWKKPFQSGSGEAVFRRKFESGLLKLYTAFESTDFELIQEDINIEDGVRFKLNNGNLYFNGSYQGVLNDHWSVFGGLSYTYGKTKLNVIDNAIENIENSFHAKLKFKRRYSNRLKLNVGAEYFATNFSERFSNSTVAPLNYGFDNNIAAAFAEADVIFSKKLALKAGVRSEYSELFSEMTLAPRVSVAYKTSENSQVSLAYGNFYQNPNSDILKFNQNLKAENTSHYILNYQYNLKGKIFRAETYYKSYDALVKFDTNMAEFDSNFNSTGDAFAKGIDVFWRDNTSIKNVDYWMSYSFIDTKRDYRNFESSAQPNFVNTHNISLVGKYWIEDWKSQVGLSYGFASGRTYTDKNLAGFLNAKTKTFNSLSLNWAYLIDQQKILYVSVNNVLGFRNVNGYQYADTPNANGSFARRPLQPANDQFFFIGFFWTISEKGTDNQLNNL